MANVSSKLRVPSLLCLGWVFFACDGSPARAPETTPVADAEVVEDTDTDTSLATDTTPSPDAGDTGRPADSTPDTSPQACDITAPTACPDPAPTFEVIEPIVDRTCVPCHFGAPEGPWPLDSYEHVTDWRDTIRSAMLDCSMPPPEEDIAMPDEERILILQWIRCGMPRGTVP